MLVDLLHVAGQVGGGKGPLRPLFRRICAHVLADAHLHSDHMSPRLGEARMVSYLKQQVYPGNRTPAVLLSRCVRLLAAKNQPLKPRPEISAYMLIDPGELR